MARHHLGWIGVCVLWLAGGPNLLAADAEKPAPLDPAALAARIDHHVAARWATSKIQAAPLTDDAEFLRRIYLDLAGRIPPVPVVRAFLDDPSPDKRQKMIDNLLDKGTYVSHMANVWRAQMLPMANNQQLQFLFPQFEVWLRRKLQDNVPYDQMVRELLTVPVGFAGGRTQFVRGGNPNEPSPLVYYQANQFKAEELAAATSRMFLGVKLECAQCHNHPFNTWTRKQFWEFAAFFAGIQPQNPQQPFNAAPEKMELRELKIPGTETTVQARFLDGTDPEFKTGTPVRSTLADWLTKADNPFFARAAANRLWAHFFGIGIIEPVDEPADDNPPSHPELLDEMGRQLAAHGFDLKYLIRAITLSKTYQLSSMATHDSQKEPRTFARMALRGLTGEQLFDSLVEATLFGEQANPNARFAGFGNNTPRGEFLTKFASQDKRTEHQTSILQALSLMNGKFIGDATSLLEPQARPQQPQPVNPRFAPQATGGFGMLHAVLDAPFLNTEGKIEALYLATLSRLPRPNEMERLVPYVERGGTKNDPKSALADVYWALLNSSEFILNH